MAANRRQHVESDNVMSFNEEVVKRKPHRRKQPFVKVSYDSGSDADAEHDEEIPVIKAKRSKLETIPGESSEDDVSGDEPEQVEPGMGWADAMAKILHNKVPEEGAAVLGKSKDYAKKKKKEMQQQLELKKERESHRQWENLYRVKPKVTEREHERSLQRTATRGVVQLFNAVKKQQKFLEDKLKEAGSETKRLEVEASISKGDFLDLLKGSKNQKKERREKRMQGKRKDSKTEETEKPMWSVLREDFMMGAKMKDWDKTHDNDGDNAKTKNANR